MKKRIMANFVLIFSVLILTGCGISNGDDSNKTTDSDLNSNMYKTTYPLAKNIGRLWKFDWYKTEAFYKGDERYTGNDVDIDYNVSDLILKAYKKDNNDSRAQAVANLPYINGFNADVNLIKDGKYSLFQTIAVANNIKTDGIVGSLDKTNGLYFSVGLSIRKNSISYWWETGENGKYYDVDVASQYYGYDLTNLTDKSDLKVTADVNGSKITYKVYNLANGNVIFDKSLDINTTKITNFKGFNKVIFRSRVKDDKASQYGEEAINESENIVNTFNIKTQPVTSVDGFLNEIGIIPVNLSKNNMAGKTVLFKNGVIMKLEENGTYSLIDENEDTNETGTWDINNSVLVHDIDTDKYGFAALKYKNGSLISLIGYDKGYGFYNLDGLVVNTGSDNLVENGTPLGNISNDMIAGKSFVIEHENEDNETFMFNTDENFTYTYQYNGTLHSITGSWQVADNEVKLAYDTPVFGKMIKSVILSINKKLIIIGFDSDGEVYGIEKLKSAD
jgi:hypothetical protein